MEFCDILDSFGLWILLAFSKTSILVYQNCPLKLPLIWQNSPLVFLQQKLMFPLAKIAISINKTCLEKFPFQLAKKWLFALHFINCPLYKLHFPLAELDNSSSKNCLFHLKKLSFTLEKMPFPLARNCLLL